MHRVDDRSLCEGAGALTQFQAAGGSLLEESAAMTQTQLAGPPPGMQPHTHSLARYRFPMQLAQQLHEKLARCPACSRIR